MGPIGDLDPGGGQPVVVVATGAANTASVCAALRRAGGMPVLSADPALVSGAGRVVLPGVGAFGPAMESLRATGLADALCRRVLAGQPTFGICLGLQLLAAASEESTGAGGLGVIRTPVTRLKSNAGRSWHIPNMGWRTVRASGGGPQPSAWPAMAYYANSYALDAARFRSLDDAQWAAATTRFAGMDFVAIAQRRGAPLVLAAQFHPELSGSAGQALLSAWLDGSLGQIDAPCRPVQYPSRAFGQDDPEVPPQRVIPCMDVRDGRIVKGVRFENLRDAGDTADRAEFYQRCGADELVMLDVSAGPEGRRACIATIAAIRGRIGLPLCVGGGVRTIEDAKAMLDAGADKVAVNSAAVARPELIAELAGRFGSQCVVLAIDARREPAGMYRVVVASGHRSTERIASLWAAEGTRLGAGEILLTAIDRDGTGLGYDTDLLLSVTQACNVPVIASGGGRTATHMAEAFLMGGADAVLAASIFHDDLSEKPEDSSLARIKQDLRKHGLFPREAFPEPASPLSRLTKPEQSATYEPRP